MHDDCLMFRAVRFVDLGKPRKLDNLNLWVSFGIPKHTIYIKHAYAMIKSRLRKFYLHGIISLVVSHYILGCGADATRALPAYHLRIAPIFAPYLWIRHAAVSTKRQSL